MDVKSDMLTASSTVQEILRALYFYGTDYIMSVMGRRERLVHKEQLVAMLEQGKESSTLENIMSVVLTEPMSAKTQIENVPQETALLVFRQDHSSLPGTLSRMTFEEYRGQKIKESELAFPEWWEVPLPMLHILGDRVFLNDSAYDLVSGDAQALADQIDRIKRDRIIALKGKKHERTFSLRQLTDEDFLMEDISGDFEMAEDLIWWASVGRTLFRRMEENGLILKRLTPLEDSPKDSAEVISCSWEGELLGRLAIKLPDDAEESAPDAGRGRSGEDASPKDDLKTAPGSPAERPGPTEVDERPGELKTSPPDEYEGEIPKTSYGDSDKSTINKNAARRAYGGLPRKNKADNEEPGNAGG
jgi:hypothetical protein